MSTSTDPEGGIVAIGLARSFGKTPVVVDASLTVPHGSITALVGPNGSGKTTLMLMLASLLAPDHGSVRIAGNDPVTQLPAVRAALGWMPDTLGVWPNLTVREVLTATARMYGIRGPLCTTRVEELLDQTGLAPLADQRTATLSRGQQQRLSLGRSLVHRPRVLLLDEPASGLDPAARSHLRGTLRRLAADGVAILITSHLLEDLEQVADRAVYLRDGRTVDAETLAAASSGERYRVRALDHTALVSTLAGYGAVREERATAAGPAVIVDLATEQEAVALLQRLVGSGVPVVDFAPVTGQIARTFMHLGSDGGPAHEGEESP